MPLQTTLTADIIAKEAVLIFENELVMGNLVYRGYESEFDDNVNGYSVGETISVRRPPNFTVREGATMNRQKVQEGKFSLTVDKQRGIDFAFTSKDLTLDIKDLSERVIRPAMVELAQYVDDDLHQMYKQVANWVGTPGETINSFADFSKAPQRMDEGAVPANMRNGVLSPADYWAMIGNATGLFIQDKAKSAYQNAMLGMIGDVDTFKTQNAPMHTVGDWATGGTIAVDGAVTSATISYDDVKNTDEQTITFDGFTTAAPVLQLGDVFTIGGVYDVNPRQRTKSLGRLKQFVVKATANAGGNQVDVTFSPAMIWDGAFQNIYTALSDLDGQTVTVMGTSATSYNQSLFFHKNAFSLVMVPMVDPPGAKEVSRQTSNGVSVRIIPVYDGVNDESAWRCDILYGDKALDQRLAVRASGTSA